MRIVWTIEEKQAVFTEAAVICTLRPHITNKQLLTEAQQALPYQRRCKVTDQRVFSYKSRLAAAREEAKKLMAARPEPVAEPEPVKEAPRTIDGIGDLFELLVDAITDKVLQRVEARLQQAKSLEAHEPEPRESQAFGTGWLDELEKLSIRSKQAKVKRPTALVIGLNGHQMECVKQSRPEVDFTFATAEQALSHYTFHRDHTFLMTKFINHSVQSKYRKHPNLHFVNGGVSELKTLLHGIFAGATA